MGSRQLNQGAIVTAKYSYTRRSIHFLFRCMSCNRWQFVRAGPVCLNAGDLRITSGFRVFCHDWLATAGHTTGAALSHRNPADAWITLVRLSGCNELTWLRKLACIQHHSANRAMGAAYRRGAAADEHDPTIVVQGFSARICQQLPGCVWLPDMHHFRVVAA